MSDEPEKLYDTTRRAFMKTAAAAGVAGAGIGVGAGGVAAQAQTFRFAGEVGGWKGRAPSEIEGQNNPTLQLEPGRDYVFVWENTDGLPHNVIISDGNGNNFVDSEIISEQGATQRVEFTAEAGMSTYYCEVHPTSMRGDVQTGSGTAATETTQGDDSGSRFIEQGGTVGLQEVASGPLQQPIGFTYADEDQDRRFIADQNGYVYVHGPDGLRQEPFLDINERLYYLTETRGGYSRPEEGAFDERGLLGLAFHPNFSENGKFYVRYSAPPKENIEDYVGPNDRQLPSVVDHTFRLSEFQATDDGSAADLQSERVLLEVPEPQFNHNAGDMAFGPDDYLYIAVGDGGGANDSYDGHVQDWYDRNEGGNGQDVQRNLLGSILRIDVDGRGGASASGTTDAGTTAAATENETESAAMGAGAQETEGAETTDAAGTTDAAATTSAGGDGELPYGIPEDNPLVGQTGLDEHFAWGLRNPWRISFNDGRLYVADVGQALFEEVNVVEKGGNYGWNVKEGTNCFDVQNPAQPPESCPSSTPNDVRGGEELRDPVIQYPHTYQGTQVGTSVTGGYVYQGNALSDLGGDYVFADWSRSFSEPQGRILASTPDSSDGSDGTWGVRELMVANSENGQINRFIVAFGRDRDGEVYVLTSTEGGVHGQGAVYRIVPEDQGDQISAPQGEPTATTTAAGTELDAQNGTETTGTGTTQESLPEETESGVGGALSPGQSGFGALATLGGIGIGAASLLRDDEEE